MGIHYSALSVFQLSYKGLRLTETYLETHTTKQIIDHIRCLRYIDCFDPTNKGWNKKWYDHSGLVQHIIERALLEQKYDFIKEFATHPVIEDILDVRRNLILKEKSPMSYVCSCFMYSIFYVDKEQKVQRRDPSDVKNALDTLASCTVLFDTMIKDVDYPNMTNALWAMRGYVDPLYFEILCDLMTGPLASSKSEWALYHLFEEIMNKRSKTSSDELGLYNNLLDSLLENNICCKVFLIMIDSNIKQGLCTWIYGIKLNINKDNWLRRVIEAREDLDDFSNLQDLVKKESSRHHLQKCEMYKIHAE
jgi:hypothetical protein